VLPLLTYAAPQAARDALRWRHSTIEMAQERAHQLGLAGAAFPWRTIAGRECSGYWPASTAAFHVNADIADAVVRYHAATDDDDFAGGEGLDLLVATARLWRSLGHHDAAGGFRIDGVTGPDEYSAAADNNVYTNLMAKRNLLAAAEAAKAHPKGAHRLDVDEEEMAAWRDAAAAMIVPWDSRLRVHAQADNFTNHAVWDFAATPPAIRRSRPARSRSSRPRPATWTSPTTTSARRRSSTSTTSTTTRATASTWRRWRAAGSPSCAASAASATTAGGSPSRPGSRSRSGGWASG
jgi:trehalose/maltose hydrolase-like predicted phosphorylase